MSATWATTRIAGFNEAPAKSGGELGERALLAAGR